MLIHHIVIANLRCDVGQMDIEHSVKLHWSDLPPSKKP